MKDKISILIVEDDLNLGFLLLDFLQGEGFDVKLSRDGMAGFEAYRNGKFDLCILDVMLPRMDGFALAKKIKETNPKMPFLFLTAKSLKADQMKGFNLGAEDYITKPFDEEVLLCRINVITRRLEKEAEKQPTTSRFQIGDYVFDYDRQELQFNGKAKRITEKENEILRLLCINKNKILKREEAVTSVYGKFDYFLGRSFDVFISRLRKMLSQDPRVSIDNVFKVGFILNEKN